MTIEDLERGIKLLWDQQVHSAARLDRIEALQEKGQLEMAELRSSLGDLRLSMGDLRDSAEDLRASESILMDGLTRLARVVTGLGEAQSRTEATMTALAEDLRRLSQRVDAFIAALRNGHEAQQ